jgi:hypothetical protein
MSEPKSQPVNAIAERWLKFLPVMMIGHLLITVPAFVISIALAYATFVQAEATKKIQQSETWPYVSYGTSNISDDGKTEISFKLGNDGLGPARVKQIEFLYDGKPIKTPRQFLQTCCGDSPAQPIKFMSSNPEVVLRPGETTQFIRLERRPDNAAIWDRLQDERWKVAIRACYCSIFDDCWVLDTRVADPKQVAVCPADWTDFDERPHPAAVSSTARR